MIQFCRGICEDLELGGADAEHRVHRGQPRRGLRSDEDVSADRGHARIFV